jgi:hypothetical protein
MIKTKKGVSPVIATILLVVVSIAAIAIIAGIIIPFVRDSLDDSKKCFEIRDYVTIDSGSAYTCYQNDSGDYFINISVKRGVKETNIEGFMIAISGGGSSETFEIKNGTSDQRIKMLDGTSNLVIPTRGGTRTYSLNTSTNLPEIGYAEISPILGGGGTCDSIGQVNIGKCV